jgi:putative phosphoesterase
MQTAVIADIHGNLPALRAVLEDIRARGIDRVVSLGDIVSFGPHPAACVEEIAELSGAVCLRGNHDRTIASGSLADAAFREAWPAGFVANEEWTRSRLDAHHLRVLQGWPTTAVLRYPAVELTVCHATLASDEYLLWPTAPEEELVAVMGTGGVRGCGHVHIQYTRRAADTLYFNPGSVGFPFDGDWRAAYAVVTAGASPRVEAVRVEYPRDQTLRDLEALAVPWLGPIRSSLQQALSFFSPELRIEAGRG